MTPRPSNVLQLIAEGCSAKQIAEKLNISVKTAKTHRSELMRGLYLHDVALLVRCAVQIGIVEPENSLNDSALFFYSFESPFISGLFPQHLGSLPDSLVSLLGLH